MDFLVLYITLKLSHNKLYPGRMSIASAIGAAWSLLVALLEVYTTSLLWQIMILLGAVLCAAVMTSVATGKRFVSPMLTLSYIAVSFGVGGAMTVLYGFVSRTVDANSYRQDQGNSDMSPVVFIFAAIIAGALSLIYGKMREHKLSRGRVNMTVHTCRKSVTLELLSDSGNLLRDPISRKPVIIVSLAKLLDILPAALVDAAREPDKIVEISEDMLCGARLVPVKSVMGQGIMLCFSPDKLSVDGRDIDALVGIDAGGGEYEGCDGIIPQILLNT